MKKTLSSWKSITISYLFLFIEYYLTPSFGIRRREIIAGIYFILLINLSIIILIINSTIKLKRNDFLLTMFDIPLIIYIPFSVNKILIELNYLIVLSD